MSDPRYPIGKFQPKPTITDDERKQCINYIAEAPANLRAAIKGLTDQQLDTPYRDGGWTIRQVVHHLPDSHMNAYIRVKLAMTEQDPAVKGYHENLWAELSDARTASVDISLALLESLHQRWVLFLRSLSSSDFGRMWKHPEHGLRDIDFLLQLYSWHGRHHTSQITSLKERMGWK